jgi:riboflavin-specific deaminase-like protein
MSDLTRLAPADSVMDQQCWSAIRAASALTPALAISGQPAAFRIDADGRLEPVTTARDAALVWAEHCGWRSVLADTDPRASALGPFLPICSAHAGKPIAIGQLGQSIDGCIATETGESHYITGPASIRHLHRLRALCDAVIVGARTVSRDDPRLTTRLVEGPNPVRVVLDAAARLPATRQVFTDGAAPTLHVHATGASPATSLPRVETLEVSRAGEGFDLAALLQALRTRGYARVLVEGGGVTVSSFIDAGLLDRLHLMVATLFLGSGRPGVRLRGRERLADCLRPRHRSYSLGEDVLLDCEFQSGSASTSR